MALSTSMTSACLICAIISNSVRRVNDSKVKGNVALVRGVPFLSGAPVMATDLRASAALVVAGLAAQGTTIVQGLHHLDRGYDNLEGKLRALGANLRRVDPLALELATLTQS